MLRSDRIDLENVDKKAKLTAMDLVAKAFNLSTRVTELNTQILNFKTSINDASSFMKHMSKSETLKPSSSRQALPSIPNIKLTELIKTQQINSVKSFDMEKLLHELHKSIKKITSLKSKIVKKISLLNENPQKNNNKIVMLKNIKLDVIIENLERGIAFLEDERGFEKNLSSSSREGSTSSSRSDSLMSSESPRNMSAKNDAMLRVKRVTIYSSSENSPRSEPSSPKKDSSPRDEQDSLVQSSRSSSINLALPSSPRIELSSHESSSFTTPTDSPRSENSPHSMPVSPRNDYVSSMPGSPRKSAIYSAPNSPREWSPKRVRFVDQMHDQLNGMKENIYFQFGEQASHFQKLLSAIHPKYPKVQTIEEYYAASSNPSIKAVAGGSSRTDVGFAQLLGLENDAQINRVNFGYVENTFSSLNELQRLNVLQQLTINLQQLANKNEVRQDGYYSSVFICDNRIYCITAGGGHIFKVAVDGFKREDGIVTRAKSLDIKHVNKKYHANGDKCKTRQNVYAGSNPSLFADSNSNEKNKINVHKLNVHPKGRTILIVASEGVNGVFEETIDSHIEKLLPMSDEIEFPSLQDVIKEIAIYSATEMTKRIAETACEYGAKSNVSLAALVITPELLEITRDMKKMIYLSVFGGDKNLEYTDFMAKSFHDVLLKTLEAELQNQADVWSKLR